MVLDKVILEQQAVALLEQVVVFNWARSRVEVQIVAGAHGYTGILDGRNHAGEGTLIFVFAALRLVDIVFQCVGDLVLPECIGPADRAPDSAPAANGCLRLVCQLARSIATVVSSGIVEVDLQLAAAD